MISDKSFFIFEQEAELQEEKSLTMLRFHPYGSFTEVCSVLNRLLADSDRQVPPGWSMADLVVAVTHTSAQSPLISQYDSLDLLINGDGALIYEQVCRHIDLLGGHIF